MALVEISHDEFEKAKETLGSNICRTGALRWWRPLEGSAILQSEWISGAGSRIWVDIPTIAEMPE